MHELCRPWLPDLSTLISMCVLRSVCILLANRIDELLHLTLRPEEMEHVVAYLKTVNKPLSHDLLVLHYLQQSRLAEASQLESMFTSSMVSGLFFLEFVHYDMCFDTIGWASGL